MATIKNACLVNLIMVSMGLAGCVDMETKDSGEYSVGQTTVSGETLLMADVEATMHMEISDESVSPCSGLSGYSDRVLFSAEGTIAYNYGYEDFGPYFSFPSDPWTRDGITYQTGNNLIVGPATWYRPLSNVFANNQWTPIRAFVETSPATYNMLGFDAAYIGRNDPVILVAATNLATYRCDLVLPNVNTAQDFHGFITTNKGEYFTGFGLYSRGTGSAPVIDNTTLGNYRGVIEVELDIKPGSDDNPINLSSKGVIPVAILSTADFDATRVDGATVAFAGAAPAHGSGHFEDVDNDGDIDWVGHFRTQNSNIVSNDVEAGLSGKTVDGDDIEGVDAIRIVP